MLVQGETFFKLIKKIFTYLPKDFFINLKNVSIFEVEGRIIFCGGPKIISYTTVMVRIREGRV